MAAARPKRVLDSAAVAAVALPAGAATPATSAPVVKRQRVNYVAPAVAAAAPALEAAASNQKPAPVASAYAPATDSPASADDGDAADDDEMGSEPGGEPSDGGTEEPETAWEEPAELVRFNLDSLFYDCQVVAGAGVAGWACFPSNSCAEQGMGQRRRCRHVVFSRWQAVHEAEESARSRLGTVLLGWCIARISQA